MVGSLKKLKTKAKFKTQNKTNNNGSIEMKDKHKN